MREAEIPDKRSILRSWLFWVLLLGLISAGAVALWVRFTPASAQASQVMKVEEGLSSLQALQRRVDAGDAEAQRLMAIRYRDGIGVLRSAAETKRLLELSISAGNAHAMYELACLYDGGMPGVAADEEKAWDLYVKSAEHGHINAAAYVSEALSFGVGIVKKNHLTEAYAWRSVAAYLHEACRDGSRIIINIKGRRGLMNIDMYDATYSSSDAVGSTTLWLRRLEKRLSVQDILVAQDRSREILAQIQAKRAKK